MHLTAWLLAATWAATRAAHAIDQPNSHLNLTRRFFDPDDIAPDWKWNKYVAKGARFLCLLHASDAGAGFLLEDARKPPSAASLWSGELRAELALWGWHEYPVAQQYECDFEVMNLKSTFEGLHMNPKSKYNYGVRDPEGDNECFSVHHFDPDSELLIHEQKYMVGKKEYTETGGSYKFGVNVQDGGLFAKNIDSPTHAVYERWNRAAKLDELPALRHCSDIYWAYWIRDNPKISGLRIYLAHTVINEDANELVSRAFHNIGAEMIFPWPGHTFETSTDEGKALLGSPIGGTIAHMLIAHKHELGVKTITRVKVVTDDLDEGSESPPWALSIHLIFFIEDVPPAEVEEPGPPENEEDPPPDNKEKPGEPAMGNDTVLQAWRSSGDHVVHVHEVKIWNTTLRASG